MSTNMRTPLWSRMKSPSRDCSSILRLYWKPEQPPGTTRTRSPEVSGRSSSLDINFLISVAADSLTLSAMVGAVVADISFLVLLESVIGVYLIALCLKRQVRVSSPRSRPGEPLPQTLCGTLVPGATPDD